MSESQGKRLWLLAVPLALICVTFVGVGIALADSVGGNAVIDRTFADTFRNFHLVDTNNPFPEDDDIEAWEVFAKNANPVQLVIYRKTGSQFAVVGRSPLETPQVGLNRFELDSEIEV